MLSRKPARRGPTNKWTQQQRTALDLLYTQFDLEKTERRDIFNRMFEADLTACGLPNGLACHSLRMQYDERHKDRSRHLWDDILRAPQTVMERVQRRGFLDHNREAAEHLKIQVDPLLAEEDGLEQGDDLEDDDNLKDGADIEDEDGLAVEATIGAGAIEGGEQDEDDGIAVEAEYESQDDENDPQPGMQDWLDMVHHSLLDWQSGTSTIESIEAIDEALLSRKSPVYFHGSQLHDILITAFDEKAAFMVCDPAVCTRCSDSADSTLASKTHGMPFVHRSDTLQVDDYYTCFQYSPQASSTVSSRTTNRLVQFKGLRDNVACKVRICSKIWCKVCEEDSSERASKRRKTRGFDEDEMNEEEQVEGESVEERGNERGM